MKNLALQEESTQVRTQDLPFNFYQHVGLAKKVAHDIKSPLSALKILLASEKQTHTKYKKLIKHSMAQIEATLEQLRSNNQKTIHSCSACLYHSLLMLDKLKNLEFKGLKEINLSFDVSEDLKDVELEIDSFELSNIISNLVNNSYKAVNEGGIIDVQAKLKNQQVVVSICDNGRGISSKILNSLGKQQIFQDISGGEGVAVYNASQSVQAAGGYIMVSTQHRVGTSFIIRLPLKGKKKPLQ